MRETSELPTASLRATIVTRHSRTHVIPAKAGIPPLHPHSRSDGPPPAVDGNRHNATELNEAQRKLVPARAHEATAFRWISPGMDCRRQLTADWTLRHSRTLPRHSRTHPRHSREGGNLPLRPGRSGADAPLEVASQPSCQEIEPNPQRMRQCFRGTPDRVWIIAGATSKNAGAWN